MTLRKAFTYKLKYPVFPYESNSSLTQNMIEDFPVICQFCST